jgi:class 3 adenylate cyclase
MATEHLVTLFTDIVGSTELSMAHTPDEAEAVRRTHFAILRRAVADTGGTEVKGLGDGIMVVFGAASAALACGIGMQQGVELENRRSGQRIGLRIGMSGGEVVCDDGDYYGDSVVEAARLCAVCESGQVLVSEVVRLLAGRRNPHHCRPVGEFSLRGLPYPVETFELVWEPLTGALTHSEFPLPRRLAVLPEFGVVGRSAELRSIAAAAQRAADTARRQIVLTAGEAGFGKTTLVAAAARAEFERGACLLFGHCEEDVTAPYQLFAETLTQYVTHASDDELLAHIEEHGSELVRLVPTLASRMPVLPPTRATDADSERFLLFASVVGLLTAASAERPVVLVLDDLQWADEASLALLSHLTGVANPLRVLVLGTYRDNELSPTHPLTKALATFHRQGEFERIQLRGMDGPQVIAIVEAAAGRKLDETEVVIARAVHRETDGNPFFVTEVLRHLRDTGAIHQDETGRWVTSDVLGTVALPDSIRDVVKARVGRLGPEAGRVLGLASVIGRDFDFDLLATATNTPPLELLDFLDQAAAVALVRELSDAPGRYHFAHALIQQVVYQELGPSRQAHAHRAVAGALTELCGDRPGPRIDELARHWCFAPAAADVPTAIGYARRAGDAALAKLAPSEALRYYETAIRLGEQTDDHDPTAGIDVAIGLGTAQRQLGDPAFRETLLGATRRAATLGDTERLVSGALANDRGWATASGTVDNEKVELLELALERLSAHHPDRALVLGNLCAELAFSSTLEHRRALADEALRIAEAAGDDAIVVRTLNHLVFPLLVPPMLEQQLTWSAQALTRAERIGDPVLLYFAAMYRATVATRACMVEEVDRCYEIAGPLVHQLDQPSLTWEYTFHRAKRAQIAGDTEEAERLATEALQIGTESGQPDAGTFFGVQLAVVHWQRGTMGELAPLIEQMIVESPGLPTLKASLAIAYAQDDRVADARQVLDDFATTGFALPDDSAWLNGMTEYAEAAITCGDARYAGPLYELLEPWAAQFSSAGGVTAEGPVAMIVGGLAALLGRYDDAERHLADSAAFCDRVGATFFAAQTQLLVGGMLIARGDAGDQWHAARHLERARALAREHGYGGLERRATETLRPIDRAGTEPPA